MCKPSISKSANEVRLEDHWKSQDPVVTSVPHSLAAIVNTDCNIRCPFCFAWNDITRPRHAHTDFSEQALSSIQDFVRRGARLLELFGGGEILLSDAFWRLLETFDRRELRSFGILSNFSAPVRDAALLARTLDYVKVSICGATPDVYEKLMKGSRWERLMANLEAVRIAGLKSVWFIYILHQSNKHQLAEILSLCDRLAVGNIIFKQLAPTVNREWYEKENVSREVWELADQINALKGGHKVRVWSDLDHGGAGFLIFSESVEEAVRRGYVCKSPWYSFVSHMDGVVRPCCYNLQASYGNLNQDPPDRIWNGATIQQFRKALSEMRYLESGCPGNCPDLACQLWGSGEDPFGGSDPAK